ncbi:MAG TPA: hypothetical protein VHZ76_01660 [Gammaproteobacteria bacterium]|jgi:hypothetical protein|nr:hypothetical protein [Gammaproteobacteria bacterium]
MHARKTYFAIFAFAWLYLTAPAAVAQTFFQFGSSKPTPTIKSPAASPDQIMSEDDFSKAVNKLSQQTKTKRTDELNQQSQQLLQQQQDQIKKHQAQTQSASNPATTMPYKPSGPYKPTAPARNNVPPAPVNENPTEAYSVQAFPTPPTKSGAGGAQPAPDNQPYTGFGSGGSNTGTTRAPSNNQSDGSWNINY